MKLRPLRVSLILSAMALGGTPSATRISTTTPVNMDLTVIAGITSTLPEPPPPSASVSTTASSSAGGGGGGGGSGGRGANYFFGFLVTFVILLVFFVCCGLGSRRRLLARREGAETLDAWGSLGADGLPTCPKIYEETYVKQNRNKSEWRDLVVRFTCFLSSI